MYAAQLAHILHYYPPQQIMVINFEDVENDPFEVATRVARFGGSDATFSEGDTR
jgi:hypothetical protein